MKHYVKPMLVVANVVSDNFADVTPWENFAGSLEELGGAITSYLFASGIEVDA